ncbi:MAG TPA: AMP-binding protein [Burkholderiaceae bacterium]
MLTFPEFRPHFARDQWTVPAVLEHQARSRADLPFLSWLEGPPQSFAQVNTTANRLAHGLRAFGVSHGERVCILLPNCPEFIYAWFALAKLGAVEVAISDAYKGSFLAHPLRLSRSRVLIAGDELAQQLVQIEDDLPDLEQVVIVRTAPSSRDAPVPRFRRLRISPFENLLSGDTANPEARVNPRDVAAVLMTSGTTGPSKGVVMPHSQFYFFAEEDVQLTRLRQTDVYMTAFPLFHGNAQFLTVYPCLIAGAQVALYPRFSASDWAGRARRSGATVTNLLGATMAFILAQPPSPDDRAHRVRCIYAAPLSPGLGERFAERFGVTEYVDGFGQTEISNVFMTPPGAERPAGASGVLVSQWFEAKLIDSETDEEVPEGAVGELVVRNKAPGIMSQGYLGMPEKTLETWRNLWFHTGDALRRDCAGWYYFVDRVKDALRRRGENISSFEVEAGVSSHPAVAECAVIGVRADQDAGEDEVMACVVVKEGLAISHAELIAWCDARMPAFMVPRYIEFLPALPRTETQKIRKRELRERGVTASTWDRIRAGCKLTAERHKSAPEETRA